MCRILLSVMEDNAVTVVCHRRSGRWEITIPEVPTLALVVERLEDVPAAARTAIARGRQVAVDSIRVLLDVHGD